MKKSYNLAKLCKRADYEFLYEIVDKQIAIVNRYGSFGMLLIDSSILDELKKKNCELTERSGIYKIVHDHINVSNMSQVHDIGIRWDDDHRIAPIRGDNFFKFVNSDLLDIFHYDQILTSPNKYEPFILLCTECIAIVMPIRVDSIEKTRIGNQMKELSHWMEENL